MKNIFFLLMILPASLLAQFVQIDFDIHKNPSRIEEQTLSQDLVKFFRISGQFEFRLKDSYSRIETGEERQLIYQQYYQGILVEGTIIKLHYKSNELYYLQGTYLASIPQHPAIATITESQAFANAKQHVNAEKYVWDSEEMMKRLPRNVTTELLLPEPHAKLVIYFPDVKDEKKAMLAYKFDISATKPVLWKYVYVNAVTGSIAGEQNRMGHITGTADTRYSGTKNIETELFGGSYRLRDLIRGDGIVTYNMQGGTDYEAAVDFTDDDNDWTALEFDNADKDNAALDVHWGTALTYDYFLGMHNWDSYDGAGSIINSYVHADMAGLNYIDNDNAVFSGYGPVYGDGVTLYSPLVALDVVAHEVAHGFNLTTADVTHNEEEEGSINEGLSDIWSACVDHYATYFSIATKQPWLIGDEVTLGSPGYMRNFADPNLAGQPDTRMGLYWNSSTDAHVDAGVLTHWFYLLSEGGTGVNDLTDAYDVDGIGILQAASIVFKAEKSYMSPSTNFADARKQTIRAAQQLYGYCSPQVISTMNAWHAVGVGASYEMSQYLLVTGPTTGPGPRSYFATDLLESTSSLSSSATVTYRSANEIRLLPGFETATGSEFIAEIVPCDIYAYGKKDNLQANTYSSSPLPAQMDNDLSVKIYPNPVSDLLKILFYKDKVENARIRVTNVDNKLVKSLDTNMNENHIDVKELAAGVYFVQIVYDGKTYSRKFVKS